MIEVHVGNGAEIERESAALGEMLAEAVAEGAGLGFLPPVCREEAQAYWRGVARDADAGARIVLLAKLGGRLAGTAQLELSLRPNGLHRAEVQKIMVASSFRRRGVARALLAALEREARARGRTTLHLDTFAHQDATRLYEECGWTAAGEIPAFARSAEGELRATRIYWKLLD